jgi:hypothetical protein
VNGLPPHQAKSTCESGQNPHHCRDGFAVQVGGSDDRILPVGGADGGVETLGQKILQQNQCKLAEGAEGTVTHFADIKPPLQQLERAMPRWLVVTITGEEALLGSPA